MFYCRINLISLKFVNTVDYFKMVKNDRVTILSEWIASFEKHFSLYKNDTWWAGRQATGWAGRQATGLAGRQATGLVSDAGE